MNFNLVDFENWDRREYYNHFIKDVVCTYSLTSNIDITNIAKQNLYPTMLWLLTSVVNEMKEFRTSLSDKGVGIFSGMNPSYTIFNKENKNFSAIWTEFDADYKVFLQRYTEDIAKYSNATTLAPKEKKPMNTFDVSMIPWTTFTAFNINVYDSGKYLLPIFTIGKFFTSDKKTLIPISIQVHHAVCDGYHVGLFLEALQKKIDGF